MSKYQHAYCESTIGSCVCFAYLHVLTSDWCAFDLEVVIKYVGNSYRIYGHLLCGR